MYKNRKDKRGRVLAKGELQRKDGRYQYTYTDPLGHRHWIYGRDIVELRKKEDDLKRAQLDGLEVYVQGRATLNDLFDRYISLKTDLRPTTLHGYLYTWDHFVKDTFGMKRINKIKFSDVLQYYRYLQNECKISIATIDQVHCLIHPALQLAVRDNILRNNPSDGVMAELKRGAGDKTDIRHALTVEQQRIFMNYVANHPVYYRHWPLFTVMFGTGCRIGEIAGLRWDDLDFEHRMIYVRQSIVHYAKDEENPYQAHISRPKTAAGIRTIPMLDVVYEAFQMEYEEQEETGFNTAEIDGVTGFVFENRYGGIVSRQSVNRTIKRIVDTYNGEEVLDAKKHHRDPIMLPPFTCHIMRHTFATRLCESNTNLKVIQSVMGHRDIQTTMNIYVDATDEKKQESFQRLSDMDIF